MLCRLAAETEHWERVAGAVSVLIAQWTANLLIHAISSSREPVFLALSIDLRILAFAGATSVFTGILFGLVPALLGTRVAPHEALKEAGRSLSGSRAASSLGGALVAVQIALSLVLLIGSGLLARSLYKLLTQDSGFRDRDVLLVQPDLRGLQEPPARQSAIAEDLLDRFRDIPGVRSASRSEETPISGGSSQWDVEVRAPGLPVRQLHAYANMVSPEYFQTLGTPLLAGRDFYAGDNAPAPQVAILNETAAHLYFPGLSPLGQTIWQTNYWVKGRPQIPVQVIGVVKDAKYRRLRDRVPPTVYRPIAQTLKGQWVGSGTYELSFDAPLADVISRVKQVSQSIDPRIGFDFHLFSTQVRDSLLRERLLAMLAGVFAALALLLASIGLYGLLSYVTQRRTGEIGIRMALGARQSAVVRMVLSDVFLLMAAGIGLGIPASIAADRLLQSMLYDVRPTDLLTFIVSVLLMIAVGALASFIPARRAARIDPMIALRCE